MQKLSDQQKLQQHADHTGLLPNGQHFIKIGNSVCDVFVGAGWNPPTRYRKTGGKWVYQHGPRITTELNGQVK